MFEIAATLRLKDNFFSSSFVLPLAEAEVHSLHTVRTHASLIDREGLFWASVAEEAMLVRVDPSMSARIRNKDKRKRRGQSP